MTLKEAREEFAALMALARRRQLTAAEKAVLKRASQTIRYAKRSTAANPRDMTKRYKIAGVKGTGEHASSYNLLSDAIAAAKEINEILQPAYGVQVLDSAIDEYVFDTEDNPRFKNTAAKQARQLLARCNPKQDAVVKRVGAKWIIFRRDEDGELISTGYVYDSKHQAQIGLRDYLQKLRRPRLNPDIVSLGRATEVRYERDFGRAPGYYKHEIETRAQVFTVPPGWIYLAEKSIVIATKVRRK